MARVVLLAAVLAAAACGSFAAPLCSSAIVRGAIEIKGSPLGWNYFQTGSPNPYARNGNSMTLFHDNRGYFGQCEQNFEPYGYDAVPLLDKTISFNVDVSSVGCACNVGLYLVAMPGLNSNGQPDPASSKDYYCDANMVGGNWCPEVDIMEANAHAFQATPHRCDAPTNGHYPSCDRGGCAQNTYRNDPNAYGPGVQYTIDTNSQFTVNTTFKSGPGNQLASMTTTLSQNGKTFTMHHTSQQCGNGYLGMLGPVLEKGMVIVLTSWGDQASTMKWLDEPPCPSWQSCNSDNQVTFSDIVISDR